MFQGEHDTSAVHEEKLERIPRVKSIAGPADVMDQKEADHKIHQFCQLWIMYAENTVELKRKSELSQESVVAACKVYVPYISDIVQELDEVIKIFAIEKEIRAIKNRGYFPVPHIMSQDRKIETTNDKDKVLETIDEIATAMCQAVKQSEEIYIREWEQARARDEHIRSVRQTDRSDYNYFTVLANSTPIRNDNTRVDRPGVHFNVNPICHVYFAASDEDDQYKPSVNESIIQTATSTPADQLPTNTTGTTGSNDPWRRKNNSNAATGTAAHRIPTEATSHNCLHNNISPNTSDNRNRPICFRCGEQGHMRSACRERVFCNHCKIYSHSTKACRKQHNNIPSPANSQITTGYHPMATPPLLRGTTPAGQPRHRTGAHNINPLFPICWTTISQEPAPGSSICTMAHHQQHQ